MDIKQTRDEFNKLAERLKKGDKKAAEEIFNHFSPLIYRFFLARTSKRELSQDLMQDVFVKLISKIETFNNESGHFSAWLWQIARNTLIDYFREKKEISFSDAPEGIEDNYKTEDKTERNIIVKEVLEVVKNFNVEDQEIFTLHYISDLSYKEISRITGKSEGALRVAIHRITKKVKDIVNSNEQGN